MRNLELSDCTRRMGAPDDWDHERMGICHTIDICDRDGWMVSGWQPTPAEIEQLRRGASIWLMIRGEVHPVISLMVAD